MTGPSLKEMWSRLDPPPPHDGLVFTTTALTGLESVRLGHSGSGPALLFQLSEPGPPTAPIELRNLAVRFNVQARVHDGEGAVEDGTFTVILCTTVDANLHAVFLEALNFLVRGAPNARELIPHAVNSLVELFRSASNSPVTSTLGLWGELFVIATSTDPAVLASAWHVLPNDRYDFGLGSERLEVKATMGRRSHVFSLEQLQPASTTSLCVASIVTESSAAGTTIRDLVDQIAARCSDANVTGRLLTGVAQALGSDLGSWSTARYDMSHATESLRFIDHASIPRPPDPPPRVSDVRFRSDLTDLADEPLATPVGPLLRAATSGI